MRKFLFAVLFSVFAFISFSQNKNIILNENNVSLKEVFNIVSKNTGYKFSYNPAIIDINAKITVNITGDLNTVLNNILPPNITHKLHSNYIILYEKGKDTQDNKAGNNQLPINTEKPAPLAYNNPVNTIAGKEEEVNETKEEFILPKIENRRKILRVAPAEKIKVNNEYLSAIITAEQKVIAEQKKEKTKKERPEKSYLPAPPSDKNHYFQFSFVYPLGMGWVNSVNNSYDYSLNMFGGITGRTNKFELAGLFNANMYSSKGVQIAGLFNLTGFNLKYKEESNNFQIAGLFNFTKHGLSNQISGLFNYADYAPLQLSVANYSNTSHTQIGVVNKTRQSALQIGLVNISDSANYMIGIVNLSRQSGYMQAGVEYDNYLGPTVYLRSGTKKLYGIISSTHKANNSWSFGTGFGTVLRDKKLGINTEIIIYSLNSKEIAPDSELYNGLLQIKPVLNYKIGRFVLHASPTVNLSIFNNDFFVNTIPYNILNSNINKISLWFGFSAGVGFKIF